MVVRSDIMHYELWISGEQEERTMALTAIEGDGQRRIVNGTQLGPFDDYKVIADLAWHWLTVDLRSFLL